MSDFETIRIKLADIIHKKGYNFRELSLKIGRKDSYIQQYIKYGLPRRLNEIDRKKICHILNINEEDLIDDELKITQTNFNANVGVSYSELAGRDYVDIDILSYKASNKYQGEIIGKMWLNFTEFGNWYYTNPFNLKIIRQESDSMEPKISIGNLVLFDASIKKYIGEGVYVIRVGSIVQIKRIQMESGHWFTLKSDNELYQDINCHINDLEIMGRATYCLGGERL